MPEPKSQETVEKIPSEFASEEDYQDYLDYCAAAEALDEVLSTDEKPMPIEDFIRELGLMTRA